MKKNQGGFTIVEALIAAGLMGALALGISSMIGNQNKQVKFLTEKLAAMDLTNLVMTVWTDTSFCTSQLTTPAPVTFNASLIGSATPPEINLTEIKGPGTTPLAVVDGPVSPMASSLKIESITIRNINGSGDSWTGSMVIRYKASSNRGVKPSTLSVKLTTDAASPMTAKTITACGSAASAPPASIPTPSSYSCTANANGSCNVSSAPGKKFCALTKVDEGTCNSCAHQKCDISGPSATGVFTLTVTRGPDPAVVCTMSCI